jgi:DNA-binding XRE family transcriptional regulator
VSGLPPSRQSGSALHDLLVERARIDGEVRAVLEMHTRNVTEIFAVALKRTREQRGLSQQGLADLVGLARTSITNMEAGRQTTTLAHAALLADALGVPLDNLVRPRDIP